MHYFAIPFDPSKERANVVSKIIRKMASIESVFTDYQKPCDDECMECDTCGETLRIAARMLSNPQSRIWEVWRRDDDKDGAELDLVGILYLTDITRGCDALAHYLFFDGKLKDKTQLLKDMIALVFEDTEDWMALNRLTVEIPEFAFALARHAHKKLGFGGDFEHRGLEVEGKKRSAITWRGKSWDLLVMGLTADEVTT
jgi:hypothetical protein